MMGRWGATRARLRRWRTQLRAQEGWWSLGRRMLLRRERSKHLPPRPHPPNQALHTQTHTHTNTHTHTREIAIADEIKVVILKCVVACKDMWTARVLERESARARASERASEGGSERERERERERGREGEKLYRLTR
jgi:hypothetical protein